MTPAELKQMALEASKKEYDAITTEMQKAAKQGAFSCDFATITDGAIQQLKDAGFVVSQKSRYPQRSAIGASRPIYYYEVSFK